MRRPLFWACLFLALTALCHFLLTGGFQAGGGAAGPPDWGEEVVFAGKVCGRETGDQKNVFLIEIDFLESSRFAAASQQVISYLEKNHTKKLRCRLAVGTGEDMPKIGSFLIVKGKFSAYGSATNPGEFDFARYYRSNGVGGQLTDAVILKESAGYSRLGEWLYDLREFLGGRLDKAFPAREAGVMKTMLLGERSGLDPELKSLYQETGIVHILSISGLHITLLGMGVYRLLRRLGVPNGAAALSGGLFLFLYGMMAGMSVSACRAIGMFLLRMLSLCLGRTYDMLTALAVLGAGMLCLEPVYLLHSGFWLSFGSLFGVGCVLPVLEELAGDGPAGSESAGDGNAVVGRMIYSVAGRIVSSAAGTVRAGAAIFLTTLPLQLKFYYEIPVFSMAANLLVLPCMGAVVGCGFLVMLIPGLGFLSVADVLMLRGFEFLCRLVQGLPFHTWNPGCPELWQIGLYYAGLITVLLLLRRRKRRAEIKGRGVPVGYRLRGIPEGFRGSNVTAEPMGKGDALRSHRKGILMEFLGRGISMGRQWRNVPVEISSRSVPVGRRRRMPGKISRKIFKKGQTGTLYRVTRGERTAAFVLKWLLIFLPMAVMALPVHHGTGLVFLDVGQGDGICLRAENGEIWLYDCGSSSKKQVGENILIPFLKHEGIRRIQGVILSHGDKDHISGLLELFERSREEGIRIDRVILPDLGEIAEEESFSEIYKFEKEGLFEVIRVSTGDRFGGSGLSFFVLNPEVKSVESDNASSLCLLAKFANREGGASILLTGDVEGAGEKVLIAELEKLGVRSIDVLKCAHHGSKNATSQAFLNAVDARIAVISCGKNNSYGHPHEELLERLEADGSAILRTDQSGAVTVHIREGKVSVEEFMKQTR